MGLPSLDTLASSARHRMWRADELGMADSQVVGTGFDALDAQLPGGGWPVGAMTELLQTTPDSYSWQLMLPALAKAVQNGPGTVALVGAPHEPFGPSLSARGLPIESLLWIRGETAPARLWASEQALRCADVAAVVAWLPQGRVSELRRLQLAAAQHESLLFVFRPVTAAEFTSPARLRLQLLPSENDRHQIDVQILKRRGPAMASAIPVPAHSARMSALLEASSLRRKLLRQGERAEKNVRSATVVHLDFRQGNRNALMQAGDYVSAMAK